MMISKVNQLRYNRGKNAVHKFVEKMLEEVEWCKKMKCKHLIKILLTKVDERNSKNADKCYIGNKKYSAKTFV